MNEMLKKIAAGVIVAVIVNKITPDVEETLDAVVKKTKNKKN